VKSDPAPIVSSVAAVVQTQTVVPLPASETAAPTGGSNTLVTSYVSETTMLYTTVTAPGSAASGAADATSDVAAGWSYYGCYSDTRARVLTGITLANIGNHQVTNTKCVAYCEEKGFCMAGTEYGGQCFCGNQLDGSSKVDESTCNMPCEGDSTQTCGGGLTLSVYSTNSTSTKKRSNRHMHRHLNKLSF